MHEEASMNTDSNTDWRMHQKQLNVIGNNFKRNELIQKKKNQKNQKKKNQKNQKKKKK